MDVAPMYGITRVRCGYQVRLGVYPEERSGFYYTECFSATKFGSEGLALHAAEAVRDQIIGLPEFKKWFSESSRLCRSRTGFRYMYASCGIYKVSGRRHAAFKITKDKSKTFSCVKRGVWAAYSAAADYHNEVCNEHVPTEIIAQRYEVLLGVWGSRYEEIGLHTGKSILTME